MDTTPVRQQADYAMMDEEDDDDFEQEVPLTLEIMRDILHRLREHQVLYSLFILLYSFSRNIMFHFC
jgi:hypothetical protein